MNWNGFLFLGADIFDRAHQTKAMKSVAAPLKLDLAQYRSLAAFAQFASDLDKATRDQLTRGEKLSEIVKQPQYQPLAVEKQVAILYAATKGKLDDVPTPKVKEFETGFYRFLETEQPEILEELGKKKALSDELSAALDKAIEAFREAFGIETPKAAAKPAKAPPEASISASPGPAGAIRGPAGDTRRTGEPERLDGQPARYSSANPVVEEHQADHAGDAVRGCIEAQARPGVDARLAAVRREDRRGPGRPRDRARRRGPPAPRPA